MTRRTEAPAGASPPITDDRVIRTRTGKPGLTRRIVVDSREQRPWFADPTEHGIEVVRQALPQGDYALEGLADVLTVERKNISDLAMVVGRERDRFLRELARLRDSCQHPFLFVEADVADIAGKRYTGTVAPSAIIGSLLGWCLDFNVTPWWGSSPRLCELAALRLFAAVERRIERASDAASPTAAPSHARRRRSPVGSENRHGSPIGEPVAGVHFLPLRPEQSVTSR